MADEQHEMRRINWTQVFSATHIFKSFKMAIHPSKLALALAAVIIIFCTGWVMDGIWELCDQRASEDEISAYFQQSAEQFAKRKSEWREDRVNSAAQFVQELQGQKNELSGFKMKIPSDGYLRAALSRIVREDNKEQATSIDSIDEIKTGQDDHANLLSEADQLFDDQIGRIDGLLDKAQDEARNKIKALTSNDDKVKASERLEANVQAAKVAKTQLKIEFARRKRSIEGRQIFASLLAYETQCLRYAMKSVWHGNIMGGLDEYRQIRERRAVGTMSVQAPVNTVLGDPRPADDKAGFVVWGLLAVHGICWLICQHWLYASIFLTISLAVIALFGGAIHRIAALHFAREEKISISQALRFSSGKFLSYFTAPLIPMAIVALMGALLALGGLLGSIPWIGMPLIGVLFFLAIILGLLIAFLLVGLVAGFGLMYPTIAVEGSDSFDAISRSFSYVFGRPWRALLYGLVALVYGAVTYLFVRFFAFVALSATHCFVKLGVISGGGELPPGSDALDEVWAAPTFDNLTGPATFGSHPIASWLIGVWVFMVAAGVLAYLLSYAASSTTVIAYLLRRKEDATDLDDVYIEDVEEEDFFEAPSEQEDESKDQPEQE